MDELVDILDEAGNPTGIKELKSVAHAKGLFHPTVHVWVYSSNGKVVLQQRGAHKRSHPLLWDVSAAGHMGAGENPEEAAIRETLEELGYSIHSGMLKKIGVFRGIYHHAEDFVDCEYHHTYICPLEVPFEDLQKEDAEVAALDFKPLVQFAEEVWGLANPSVYVPHETAYYTAVIKAIRKALK